MILEKEARGKKNKSKTLPEWVGGVKYNGVNCLNSSLNHFNLILCLHQKYTPQGFVLGFLPSLGHGGWAAGF